jgi:catechol 2,3-dioxygenase-like lactoylglutathione lyase family enzyme
VARLVTSPQRISFVTLGARDLPGLRRFYQAWGWPERDGGGDGFAQFQAGGVRLALYPLPLLRDEAAPGAPLAPPGTFTGVTLAINVDGREAVDAAHAHALAAGATRVADPVAREWGGYSGYVADPEGNRWEIAWLPGFE